MFIVFLKLANKDGISAHMVGHKKWLQCGFDDGVFLLAGSLAPQAGGGLLAHGVTQDELQARLDDDPFVAEGVVTVEITKLAASRADERLAFLVE